MGSTSLPRQASQFIQGRFDSSPTAKPEVEILFLPGKGRFSGQADCNVLVALEPEAAHSPLARHAHLLVAPRAVANFERRGLFSLDDFDQALAAVA